MSDETKAGWAEEEAALERGDVDEAVEVNMRMWVDGPSRSPDEVDPDDAREGRRDAAARDRDLARGGRGRATTRRSSRTGAIGSARSRFPRSILVGDLDRPEMLDIANRLEAEIPNSRRETIAGPRTCRAWSSPDEFDRLVLEFLA